MRCYVQLKDSGWIWRVTWEKNQKRDFIQIYFWPQSLGSFLNRKLLTPVERHLFFFFAVSALPEKVFQGKGGKKKKNILARLFFFLFLSADGTEVRKEDILTQDGVDPHWQLGSEDQNGLFANAANRETEMVQDEQTVIWESFDSQYTWDF